MEEHAVREAAGKINGNCRCAAELNFGAEEGKSAALLLLRCGGEEKFMTDKELKRLSRSELLQMLITQMEENAVLRERADRAESQLQDRRIAIGQAGSLAEAALSLSGIFQAADAAASQYLENIQRISGQQETICRELQINAEKKAADIMREAQEYSQKVRGDADAYWQEVILRARALVENQDALRELVQSSGRNETK